MNKRERILLAVFTTALVIGAGVIGWNKGSKFWRDQKSLLVLKQDQLAETQRWLTEKEHWLARERWVAGTALPVYEGQQTEAAFFQAVQASLAEHKIEIVEQRIQETQSGGGGVSVGLDLVLNSSLENLIRWLHATQRPQAFRTFTHIKLKSDPGNSNIRTETTLRQLYDSANMAQTQ